MKIGILQTGRSPDELREKYGDYDGFFRRLLADRRLEFVTYPVLDGVLPDSIHDAEGWLITGSKFGAYEDHAWIPPLEDFLRAAYAASVPIVGICFGHQILAQALGGKVEKFQGGWSVGGVDYRLAASDEPVHLIAWHQDQVTEKPEEAEVVGSTEFCRFAALAYGDKAWSIQPHPEFDGEFASDLMEARRALIPDDVANAAVLDRPTGAALIADHIEAFFKQERKNA